ncbi:hypothetical protein MP228_001333 [Amoeboaphelidium protococcarum]|nr:hypothetical protein MP228_001333 [Amoeboaphelidium protococcarum]
MVDVVLITTSSIFAALVVIGAIYFLVYFQHPDDKWVAWFPKLVVVVGLTLSCYNALLLPLDVANQGGQFVAVGGIPMAQITFAFFIATICMALAVVPFVMFYYEGMDEADEFDNDPAKQVFYAVQWTFVTLVIYFLATALIWYYAGYADIPTVTMSSQFQPSTDIRYQYCAVKGQCTADSSTVITVRVSFIMYMVACASFIGWVLFAIFGGVGLSALPFDLLIDFKNRPRRIKLEEYSAKKRLVGEQAALLLEASAALISQKKAIVKGTRWANRKQRSYVKTENEFKRDVLFLESQWKRLEDGYKNGGGNPLMIYGKLIVGIVGTFVSLFWFFHILLYVLPIASNSLPVTPFLNTFFRSTFQAPVFGIVFYGIFVFWLLLCVLKGITKMGVRFLFIEVYPVKMGETFMSALVFNVGVLLFCSLAVSQFCTFAFSQYARYTASATIFMNQLQTLRGIHYIYNVLMYVLPIMTFVTVLYIWAKPSDQRLKRIF